MDENAARVAPPPPRGGRFRLPTLKPWARWLLCGFVGIVLGFALALHAVRAGAFAASDTIGAWTTGKDFGTADASGRTRAIVALRGLLALPASEARYYNAAVDDSGQPLNGHCRYRVSGGPLPGHWWSLTLYDPQGYLVKNDPGLYAIGSAALRPDEQVRWNVAVAPTQQPGNWLPTGNADRFQLTLRVYLPADGGTGNLERTQLPAITREAC